MTKKPQKTPAEKTPSTPIIEGLRQPKPRKNPCASAWKHQKDRAENPLFHRKTGKTHGILHTQSRNKSQPEVMRTT